MTITSYTYALTDFLNNKVELSKLRQEIEDVTASGIVTALHVRPSMTVVSNVAKCRFTFVDVLPAGEQTALDNLVAAHDGDPIPAVQNIFQEDRVVVTQITSTEYTALDGMGITPGSGHYIVHFSATADLTSNNADITYALFVNNIEITHTEKKLKRGGGQGAIRLEPAIHDYVTNVGNGESIEIKWKVSGGTGSTYQRTLIVERKS